MFDLTGKTALVTGANTGLGQGMALALANAGANIALIGRTEPVETLKALTKIDRREITFHNSRLRECR